MDFQTGKIYDDFINLRQTQYLCFAKNTVEIAILRKNMDEDFIEKIKHNEVFFQIFIRENIIFLLIKFEGLNWLDIPFVIKNVKSLPDEINDDNFGYKCQILLADAMSGKLYVNRFEGLSHGLSKALYWAICEQIKNPVKNFEQKVNKVHASFSSDEMARLSCGK